MNALHNQNGNSEDSNNKLSRAEFWQRAAAASFSLWALMIPLGVQMLRSALQDAAAQGSAALAQLAALSKVHDEYVRTTERRLVLVEERQQYVLRIMAEHEKQLEELQRDVARLQYQIQQQGRR